MVGFEDPAAVRLDNCDGDIDAELSDGNEEVFIPPKND